MFPVEAFQRTVEQFVLILRRLEIPFHITGGSISSAYGEPRLTQDIDIVISPEIAKKRLDDLVQAISKSDFLYTEQVMRNGILKGEMFQLLDIKESLKLDIYPRELIPGELGRSETAELFAGIYLPIVSRTDAAISKLIWVAKGSHRSRRDLRSIFRNCNPSQQVLIRQYASSLGIDRLLEIVLSESDDIR
jgi:hypothetical protein